MCGEDQFFSSVWRNHTTLVEWYTGRSKEKTGFVLKWERIKEMLTNRMVTALMVYIGLFLRSSHSLWGIRMGEYWGTKPKTSQLSLLCSSSFLSYSTRTGWSEWLDSSTLTEMWLWPDWVTLYPRSRTNKLAFWSFLRALSNILFQSSMLQNW